MKKMLWIACWTCCLTLPLSADGFAATVKLGQSCTLTGPLDSLGREMSKGAKLYIEKRAAGELELITKDDSYDPKQAVDNTQAFLQDGVQVLFGYLGTPTAKAVLPVANENKVLFFGAGTGADFLSDAAANPYSFVLRPSYDAEVENMLRHLKEDLGIKTVSLFVQKDSVGLAGVRAAVKALQKIEGIKIVPEVPPEPETTALPEATEWNEFWSKVPHYKRGTLSVGTGVRQVRGSSAEAVILVGVARACALAINQWRKTDFNVPMVNISFVGSNALADQVKDSGNIYVSQVVPDPWDAKLPIVKQYQEDMGNERYNVNSFEAYFTAKVLHDAVKNVKGEVNSESIKAALEGMTDHDAGGIKVSFGPNDRRGIDSVYLTKIEKDGDKAKLVYVDKLEAVKADKK
ncbi:ABC transporter substrate-binding protein [Candidatus Electronema sp. TJ]|uniref:ABC transporter substrate-binding protein n=1 Tax=Candidatus Electronema sp. TJ TaxID=3401573 RepID=UPI003AA8109A